ncbi:acetyl-CoA synthetase [Rhizobiales bacterium GAS191]|nr:acetyl-CoA synthetase [Rhizobiales bacterium GAS191]
MSTRHEPIWRPSPERVARSALTRLAKRCGVDGFDGLCELARTDLDTYWRAVIADLGVEFRRDFARVLDTSQGIEWPRWFTGGQLNFTDAALSGGTARPDDPALICLSEARPRRQWTRAELRSEVEGAMARLCHLGIGKGDRVALLLPNIAETAFAMLAIARLGAIVVPLYSGFGPEPISTRINACDAKLLITCDGYVRNGQARELKPIVDVALASCPSVAHVIMIRNLDGSPATMVPSRDIWWDDLPMKAGDASRTLDPNDPWMIIFTSGTTGRPKGTVHVHGGFPLRVAHDVAYHFDFHPGDRFFWYSDMGWMIGPMAVCAPLMLGGALVLFDGGPNPNDPTRLLRAAMDACVTHYGSSPTMLRMMASAFPSLPHALAPSFKVLMTAGEVIDEETFRWYAREIGGGTAPIINYTGGTEVSGGILSNVVVRPIVPGTFNAAVTDVVADVADEDGRSLRGTIGELVLRRPMLGMTKGFWNEPERYVEAYWVKRPGLWSHGDLAIAYEDGHWELRGRSDDVLKISGRRVGPSEIEEAAISGGEIVAAAAIGVPDPKSGQAVMLFVVPRDARAHDDVEFGECLRRRIGAELGAGLRPKHVVVVTELPRTRNAKILRRVVRSIMLGEPLGDLSSLENPSSIDAVRLSLTARGLIPSES